MRPVNAYSHHNLVTSLSPAVSSHSQASCLVVPQYCSNPPNRARPSESSPRMAAELSAFVPVPCVLCSLLGTLPQNVWASGCGHQGAGIGVRPFCVLLGTCFITQINLTSLKTGGHRILCLLHHLRSLASNSTPWNTFMLLCFIGAYFNSIC